MPLSGYGILPHVSASRPSQGTPIRYTTHLLLSGICLYIVCRKGKIPCRLQVTDLAVGPDGEIVSASLDRYLAFSAAFNCLCSCLATLNCHMQESP